MTQKGNCYFTKMNIEKRSTNDITHRLFVCFFLVTEVSQQF